MNKTQINFVRGAIVQQENLQIPFEILILWMNDTIKMQLCIPKSRVCSMQSMFGLGRKSHFQA